MNPGNVVFILGVGRSGTSLLQSMLDSHSEIAFLPETQFFRKYVIGKEDSNWRDSVLNDQKLQKTTIDISELLKAQNARSAYSELLESYLNSQGKMIVGDKDPRLLDYTDVLKEEFSKAKVVHIIRDPRDVVLSRTKAEWSKKWPIWLHAATYASQMKLGKKNASFHFGVNYTEVYYEDLIEDPEYSLKLICDHLGVKFEKSMLVFQQSAKKLVRNEEMQWKKETLGQLLVSNTAKWKKELTVYQIRLIELVCKEVFELGKYERSALKLTLLQALKVQIMVFGASIFKILYPWRVSLSKK